VKKLALTMLAVTTMSVGFLVTGPTAAADDRGPAGPGGVVGPVGVNPVVGPAGPVGVGGLGPVAGPVGPVGVGGVVGPVGLNPIVGPAGPVGVGGVVGPVGVDPIVDAALGPYYYVPFFPGEIPCYTPEGVAYFTPVGEPCY
jgi:hypothetical protein